MSSFENPLLMFSALFTLYSPLATVSSYFPVVARLSAPENTRLALGLFVNVSVFALVALWIGEPLLELLGISTDALVVTGAIAMLFVGVPQMRGKTEASGASAEDVDADARRLKERGAWRALVFMPSTFPLTVGGTTFAILVSFRARAGDLGEVALLSVTALAYAAVTALTLYVASYLERRVSRRTRDLLERIAGILLTAIAVSLLAKGAPPMILHTLEARPS
jgi:multiple antibiotic resistance protein